MTLDECCEHFDDTGHPYFKCYDAHNMTIRLRLKFNIPYYEKFYVKEMVDGSYELISYFDGGDTWQID